MMAQYFNKKSVLLAAVSGIGATIGIGVLAWAELLTSEFAMLMAPFGATAVIIFGLPTSPLAQPRNVVFGHLITAFIGIFFTQFIGVTAFTLALATGLAVSAMLLTKTTHPPAGANPMLIMMSGQSWSFLVTPVLLGAITLVLIAKVVHFVYLWVEEYTDA